MRAAADLATVLAAAFGGNGPPPWWKQGLCAQADPDAWFPEKGESTRPAKAICRKCPVRAECLTYALEHREQHGVWGGLSERERSRLRQQLPEVA